MTGEITKPGADPIPCQNATCDSKLKASICVEGMVTEGSIKKVVTLLICSTCAAPILRGQKAVSVGSK